MLRTGLDPDLLVQGVGAHTEQDLTFSNPASMIGCSSHLKVGNSPAASSRSRQSLGLGELRSLTISLLVVVSAYLEYLLALSWSYEQFDLGPISKSSHLSFIKWIEENVRSEVLGKKVKKFGLLFFRSSSCDLWQRFRESICSFVEQGRQNPGQDNREPDWCFFIYGRRHLQSG
jgi:hypothetical protein